MNFSHVKKILEKDNRLVAYGPIEQGTFLNNMGAKERLDVLLANCAEDQREALKSGYDMITNSNKMGSRFKFLSMFPFVLKDHLTKFPVNGF